MSYEEEKVVKSERANLIEYNYKFYKIRTLIDIKSQISN